MKGTGSEPVTTSESSATTRGDYFAGDWICLCFSFLTCEMGIIITPSSQSVVRTNGLPTRKVPARCQSGVLSLSASLLTSVLTAPPPASESAGSGDCQDWACISTLVVKGRRGSGASPCRNTLPRPAPQPAPVHGESLLRLQPACQCSSPS